MAALSHTSARNAWFSAYHQGRFSGMKELSGQYLCHAAASAASSSDAVRTAPHGRVSVTGLIAARQPTGHSLPGGVGALRSVQPYPNDRCGFRPPSHGPARGSRVSGRRGSKRQGVWGLGFISLRSGA
jgi:hypothetical protein